MKNQSSRKFYRTLVTVEVLSESPIEGFGELSELAYAITEGDCSGEVTVAPAKKLTGKQAAKALLKQGSDPSFFRLTDKGEDLED